MSLPFQNSAKVKIVVPSSDFTTVELGRRGKQTQTALAHFQTQSNQA